MAVCKMKIIINCMVSFFLILYLTTIVFADHNGLDAAKESMGQLLFQLSDSNNSDNPDFNQLLIRWHEYFQETSYSSHNEYIPVLQYLTAEYYKTAVRLNECAVSYKKDQTKYSALWVEKLGGEFGKKYIVENKLSITTALMAINSKNLYEYCKSEDKESIYIEAQLLSAYQYYFDLFFDFISSLDKPNQKKLEKQKQLAHKILSILKECPLTHLTSYSYRHMQLMEKAKNSVKPELFSYLSNSPILSKPFDVVRAVSDLEQYCVSP